MDRVAIEKLSRLNLKNFDNLDGFSMDRVCNNSYREKKLKRLDKYPSCREVSKSCRDCLKTVFQRREKYRHECNQTCYSIKDPNNILNSQKNLLTRKMSSIQIQNTHIHIKQVQPILYFKNKLRQFSEYKLTHVFHVMAKSHCTCTCIKSNKEYCVLCVKISQDCISVYIL